MHGVMKNIAHLCSRHRSSTWGNGAHEKVTVCIISDGRNKINPRTLSVLTTMGVYQEGVAKNIVEGKPVTAHIYEVYIMAIIICFFSMIYHTNEIYIHIK